MTERDTNGSVVVAWIIGLVLTLFAVGIVATCIGLMGALT